MAQPSFLYRFRIELSDIDRNLYQTLDFRVAQHPSETASFLLTRVLAFVLNFSEGLEFAPGGLSDTDEPNMRVVNPTTGATELCIEIGNPSAKRLHKNMKSSKRVLVYTYKDTRHMLKEIESEKIHRLEELEIYFFDPKFLSRLEPWLERDNRWSIMHNDGNVTVTKGETTETIEVVRL